MNQRAFATPPHLSLRLTLGKRADPAGHRGWWVSRTPEGPGTALIQQEGWQIEAAAWGSGADWMLERIPDLLGFDDHPEDFTPSHRLLEDLHKRNRGLRVGRTNRVFEAIRVGRPLWRVNWLVSTTPELHLPLGLEEKSVSRGDPREELWLRTERQTLLRLPGSGAVVFGIKTSVSPVEALAPAEIIALRAALAAYDAETVAYKGGRDTYRATLARLEEIACQAGGGGSC